MKTRLYVLVSLIILPLLSVHAQGLKAPAPGKAAIYFVRVSAAGFAIPFDFFHNDKWIGDFAGKNYIRYEADPGEQLFWASSENHEFLTTEFTDGGIYMVVVDVNMGFAVARVGFSPVTSADKLYERVKKVIDKKAPVIATAEELKRRNETRAEFIQDKLKKYHEKWKTERKYKHVSPEMAIPLSL